MKEADFELAMRHFFNETTAQAIAVQYPVDEYKSVTPALARAASLFHHGPPSMAILGCLSNS